jgi:phage-related protein
LVHYVMAKPVRPKRTITAEFYRTEAGNEPVRKWLLTLSKSERQEIGRDIRKTEYGWPIGMPTCDSLGEGLWEIRTTLANRIARVFFCMVGARMVLLHGIIKKDRTAPKVDLETARDRKANLDERLGQLSRAKRKTRVKP